MQHLLYLSNQSGHSQIQHLALDLTTTLVNFWSSVINACTSFFVGSGRVISCREFLPILTCRGEHILISSTISGKSNFTRGSQVTQVHIPRFASFCMAWARLRVFGAFLTMSG